MAKALQSNVSLSMLDVSGCKLGHEGASQLSIALAGNSKLTHLVLAKNSLGDRGAAAIATLLPRNQLVDLNISQNQIRTTGAESLARSMLTCTVRNSVSMLCVFDGMLGPAPDYRSLGHNRIQGCSAASESDVSIPFGAMRGSMSQSAGSASFGSFWE